MIEVIKVYGVFSDFLKYAAAFVFKSEIAADEYGNVLETLAKYRRYRQVSLGGIFQPTFPLQAYIHACSSLNISH